MEDEIDTSHIEQRVAQEFQALVARYAGKGSKRWVYEGGHEQPWIFERVPELLFDLHCKVPLNS